MRKIGPRELMQLEDRLAPDEGKLVFSREDVAIAIADFYNSYFIPSLRKDVKNGREVKQLYRYLEPIDESGLPEIRAGAKRHLIWP